MIEEVVESYRRGDRVLVVAAHEQQARRLRTILVAMAGAEILKSVKVLSVHLVQDREAKLGSRYSKIFIDHFVHEKGLSPSVELYRILLEERTSSRPRD